MPFESHLELRHRPGHNRWEVIRELHYRTADGRLIVVPVGYLSDMASVPRLARQLVDPQTPAVRRPSVVHDFVYTDLTHRFTNAEADQILYESLIEEGMGKFMARLIWCAVRLSGRGNWGK